MAAPAPKRMKENNARVQPLLFEALEADLSNYPKWSTDVRSHLSAEDLDATLESATPENLPKSSRWKALILLRRHMDISLQYEYILTDNPYNLWEQLEDRFKKIFFPQAHDDWIHLRVMDFPNFMAFNADLHRIASQLRSCGEKISDERLIEKTLSTFPPASAMLALQCRNVKFKTHSEMMSCLFVTEKHTSPTRDAHTTAAAAQKPYGNPHGKRKHR
ncbi:hypothetical protein M758_9G033600 [Ceratodon purpureus]|nr:hypothetical protein M758_9G033600 [Ceratodon purpureus]